MFKLSTNLGRQIFVVCYVDFGFVYREMIIIDEQYVNVRLVSALTVEVDSMLLLGLLFRLVLLYLIFYIGTIFFIYNV